MPIKSDIKSSSYLSKEPSQFVLSCQSCNSKIAAIRQMRVVEFMAKSISLQIRKDYIRKYNKAYHQVCRLMTCLISDYSPEQLLQQETHINKLQLNFAETFLVGSLRLLSKVCAYTGISSEKYHKNYFCFQKWCLTLRKLLISTRAAESCCLRDSQQVDQMLDYSCSHEI